MKNNLKKIRAIKGLSQEKLAEEASISRPYLSDIEGGKINPSTFVSLRLAGILDCSVEDIFLHELSYKVYKGTKIIN